MVRWNLLGRKNRLCHFLLRATGCRASDVEIHRCTEGRLCQCPERFFAYPFVTSSIVAETTELANTFLYFFLRYAVLISLSFLLLLDGEQPNAGLNERNHIVVARISRNKSTRFFFFFFFNSFEHLLSVISCFPSLHPPRR